MIHSGLVSQNNGYGLFPHQRNNHPRDYEMRPWVAGVDLPILEKSGYATPATPETSRLAHPVMMAAQTKYHDIFEHKASPDLRYYLSQIVNRVARGGTGNGGGGAGPSGMMTAGPLTGKPSVIPGLPSAPTPVLTETPLTPETPMIPEAMVPMPGDYPQEGVTLNSELVAETTFDKIFYVPENQVHEEDIDTGAERLATAAEQGLDLETLMEIDPVPDIVSHSVPHSASEVTSSGPTVIKNSFDKIGKKRGKPNMILKPKTPKDAQQAEVNNAVIVNGVGPLNERNYEAPKERKSKLLPGAPNIRRYEDMTYSSITGKRKGKMMDVNGNFKRVRKPGKVQLLPGAPNTRRYGDMTYSSITGKRKENSFPAEGREKRLKKKGKPVLQINTDVRKVKGPTAGKRGQGKSMDSHIPSRRSSRK